MSNEQLKQEVKDFWNQASCGTEHTDKEKFSLSYFEEIEEHRYTVEPEIFSFAQFSRFNDKKVLEVGVGAGTDFLQWVRSGAQAYGIDLTREAIENVKKRLNIYGLQASDLQIADAEHLPYQNNFFDCVYSWGVIHHSPNTQLCLQEIIRVAKPSGIIKVMIYNRHSLFAFYRWLLAGLFKGRPFRSFADVLFYDQESLGTKAYTFKEVGIMLAHQPVTIKKITAPATNHDLLYYKPKPVQFLARCLAHILGRDKCGWFLMIELRKN